MEPTSIVSRPFDAGHGLWPWALAQGRPERAKRVVGRQGIVFIISAPSGAGKTTLIKGLLKRFPEMALSVSYTTRPRRAGEANGRDYRFVTRGRFSNMGSAKAFAEWAGVHGYLYGTPRAPLERAIRSGQDMLLDIDVQGARKIKRQYPAAVSIFVLPPSWRELEKRLALRGTDRKETIRKRLANARREIRAILGYDYFVVNRELRIALEALQAVVLAERLRVSRLKASK